jgi:hypothetical protein
MKPIKWYLWKIKSNTKSRLLNLRYSLNYKKWWKDLYYDPNFLNGKVPYNKWDNHNNGRNRKKAVSILKSNLTGKTVFEFGAGPGYFTKYMLDWGYSVTPTDFVYGRYHYDITKDPWPMKYDNVVGMGVLHHIVNNKKFNRALINIKAMAKDNIILGIKLDHNPNGLGTKKRPLSSYKEVLGEPTKIQDAGYLTIIIFKNNGDKTQ